VTVWANDRSIHIFLDGELVRTRPSRFAPADLKALLKHGAHIAGPEPAPSALPPGPLPAGAVVEVERQVARDGYVCLGGQLVMLSPQLTGQQVVLRFEGQLMHVIADGHVHKTLPAPIPPLQRASLSGARAPGSIGTPPPARPLTAGRRVGSNGQVMVAGQRLPVGRTHSGKTVTVLVEDTIFRVLDGDVELSTHARDNNKPVTRFKAHARPNG
jgi:ribosomal protein L27